MKFFLTAMVALLIFCTGVRSQSISMTVDATQQGKFKAENARQTMDRIEVLGATLEVSTPTDLGGIRISSTGRRQYQPFLIKKMAGASSPQFLQALASNEVLKKVVIEFSSASPTGEQGTSYVITLENARVTGFKQSASVPENATLKTNMATAPLMDEIKLVYQKITVESNVGKTMFTDDMSRF